MPFKIVRQVIRYRFVYTDQITSSLLTTTSSRGDVVFYIKFHISRISHNFIIKYLIKQHDEVY